MAIVLFGIVAALLIAVVILVSGSRSSTPARSVRILSVETSDDSRVIDLTLAVCPRQIFGTLDEQADTVRVGITGNGSTRHGCPIPRMPMQLKQPLGDRPVVDTSTGQAVTVHKVPASQLVTPIRRPLKRAIQR